MGKRLLIFEAGLDSSNDVEFLQLKNIPSALTGRYSVIPSRIYVRKCYREIYDVVTTRMLRVSANTRPVFLFTGVPGIGKSVFLVYFLYRFIHDNRFHANIALEFEKGKYHSYRREEDGFVEYPATDREIVERETLLLNDMTDETCAAVLGKWTLIFSSPNPARYKEHMKGSSHTFTLPTWSEEELRIIGDPNNNSWLERFEKCGGVPRIALWTQGNDNGDDPMKVVVNALRDKGPNVIDRFFKNGFGGIDAETNYSLIHVNPLSDEEGTVSYASVVYTFASDWIFLQLQHMYNEQLVNSALGMFNAGGSVASESHGPVSAGHLFEKICLWLAPIAEKTIRPRSLSNGQEMRIEFPGKQLLPIEWKTENMLNADILYQPRICNLESGDAFCLITSDKGYCLVVVQCTVAERHPIRANGLKTIVNAFKTDLRNRIMRKVILFVVPIDGTLKYPQPLVTQDGKVFVSNVPSEAQNFEQWVYRYDLAIRK